MLSSFWARNLVLVIQYYLVLHYYQRLKVVYTHRFLSFIRVLVLHSLVHFTNTRWKPAFEEFSAFVSYSFKRKHGGRQAGSVLGTD